MTDVCGRAASPPPPDHRWRRIRCLRCDGSGHERKRPNLPRARCYWCAGTGVEPSLVLELTP